MLRYILEVTCLISVNLQDNYFYHAFTAHSRFDTKSFAELSGHTSLSSSGTIFDLSSKLPETNGQACSSGLLARSLRRQRHSKHPSRKVKLIISNAHAEEIVPSATLISSNERNLRPLQPEARNTNSRGSFAASLVLMGKILDRKRQYSTVSSSSSKKPQLIKPAANPTISIPQVSVTASAYKAAAILPSQPKKSTASTASDRGMNGHQPSKHGGNIAPQNNLLLSHIESLTPAARTGNGIVALTANGIQTESQRQFPLWTLPTSSMPSTAAIATARQPYMSSATFPSTPSQTNIG